ncbi:uncharacterized protein LOC126781395 [Nymphalis io]|uniref:uncharacterized protein LOC126781395 n=1 Tax=Inachis io TaxID=171585 RepID=UPI002168F199|nr:uncharacterized protein LOC126781395 [Nymphalis io]
MGDLTDLFTTQRHQNLFYKVTNGGLTFYVKGSGNASVGLARAPKANSCIYWILIGCKNSCFIMNKGLRYKYRVTPYILSKLEYRKFWISWNDGFVKLGRGDDEEPIFSLKNPVQDLHYVTFSVLDQNNVLYWKVFLPPKSLTASLRQPALTKVEGGTPHWVLMNNELPEDAVIGGYEKETLYIMRAYHENTLIPGKFVQSVGNGYVPWGGRMHEKYKFQILCGYDCVWIPVINDKIPVQAIEAGYTEVGHEVTYIGRALCNGNLIPGKITPSHSVCYVPYDGIEIAKTEYEILVDPFKKKVYANSFYLPEVRVVYLTIMGDLCDFITWPKHQNIYYKVTSDSLLFSLKGERNAAIGLAKEPGNCSYWILIGYDQQCWIKTHNGKTCCNVHTRNILSIAKYKTFWLTWRNGKIALGRSNNKTPILKKQTSLPNLKYVTFSVIDAYNPLYWKCQLAPIIEKPKLLAMPGGEPRWVKAYDQLPDEAMIGGYETGVLYIIRAPHQGSLTPGKFVPELGLGFVPWGGEMHEKNEFEVLCGYNCTWIKTIRNEIPVGAIEGGYSEDGHEILYVGRALCEGYLIPGKVQPSHNCCYISYNGKEIASQEYEILILSHIKTKSAHNFYLPGFGDGNNIMINRHSSGGESEEEEIYLRDDDESELYLRD